MKIKTRLFKHEHTNSKSARIRRYILENPGTKSGDVAKKFGVDVQIVYNVRYHMRKLSGMMAEKFAKKTRAVAPTNTASVTISVPPTPELPIQMIDMVNSPPHYKHGGIETIDFIKAKLTKEEYRGYLKGNVLKYASRAGHKGSATEDAGKMAWYAQRLAELGD